MKKIVFVVAVFFASAYSDEFKPIFDYGMRVVRNADMLNADIDPIIKSKEKTDKGEPMVNYQWNKYCYQIIVGDKKGVKSFILNCGGDGTQDGAIDIMLTTAAASLALKKNIPGKADRRYIGRHLSNRAAMRGQTHHFRFGKYKMTVGLSKYTGYMITADRIKK